MMPATRERSKSHKAESDGDERSEKQGRAPSAGRSIWKGVISFGMVAIPVRLYPATSSKDVAFNMLHEKCKSRLNQKRWCPVCEAEVAWDEIVKGYQYSKDQYVIFTEEDFEKAPVATKHTVNLSTFVKAQDIDPVYYEKSYYLEPEDTAKKSFALLMKTLQKKEQTAIGQIALREKERLCALRPHDGSIILETLYYPDEIRVAHDAGLEDIQVSHKEIEMAGALVDLMAGPFDPEEYHDEYRDAILKIVEAKLEGQEIVEAAPAEEAQIIDLAAALKASFEAAKKRKDEGEKRKAG